ncbi:MAG: 40S ribosomal protein S19 [Candidatus Woesearchaeota archaeon]
MDKLIQELTKNDAIQAPLWAKFVKTGVHKERPPVQDNWWVIRSASVLKKVAKLGPIGTNNLAKLYGGRQNRGYRPDVKKPGSRNIIRKVLQQLEQAGLIQANKEGKAGKVLTVQGKKLLQDTKEDMK